ncbi:MAG: hypothetical protein BWK76_06580 [Desulfobulbaceae bacterium A2]|nr:MAG: hypothetical protein BWK76_06580 [Desulfobulbaceae bacterium A2]
MRLKPGIRGKVMVPLVVMTLVLGGYFYGYWLPHTLHQERAVQLNLVRKHMESVTESLIPLMLSQQLDSINENLSALKAKNSEWVDIRLFDHQERQLYPIKLAGAAPVVTTGIPLSVPIRLFDDELGRLEVRVDLASSMAEVRRHGLKLLYTIGLLTAVVLMGMFVTVELAVIRPIRGLVDAAARMAKRDFAATLPRHDDDEIGSLVTCFSSMRHDLQAYQANLEAEIVERNLAEERFRQVSETIREVFWLCSLDWQEFYYVSPAYELVWGQSCEDLYRSPGAWFESVVEDDRRLLHQAMLVPPACNTRETLFPEYRIRRPDGSIVWISARVFSVCDAAGRPYRLAGIAGDISERKLAEKEQEKLQRQLAHVQKMESVGRLAGGVAHDFNNMLGVILGRTELALQHLEQSHPLFADLQEVKKAARRSADLTRQLLAFASKQTIIPQVLDLNETVEDMLKMLHRLIGEDIELSWHAGNNLWLVQMDPSQIDQVLANLCVNARDAIAGVGKITIETQNTRLDAEYCAHHTENSVGDYVRLTVSDTGYGIARDDLGKIFEPFFTTKEIGQGTGLGLATVYGIVKQNDGSISVSSEPGQGTTFTVFFPRHSGDVDKSALQPAAAVTGGHETILLVEDEPALLEMTRSILIQLGYTTLSAAGPTEARQLAEEHAGPLALILSDVIMPEMNGWDLAQHILVRHPQAKCLFMSGYTADVISHRGMLGTRFNFIQKPFSVLDLSSKIREVLDQA